jgi:hypothetical protein
VIFAIEIKLRKCNIFTILYENRVDISSFSNIRNVCNVYRTRKNLTAIVIIITRFLNPCFTDNI